MEQSQPEENLYFLRPVHSLPIAPLSTRLLTVLWASRKLLAFSFLLGAFLAALMAWGIMQDEYESQAAIMPIDDTPDLLGNSGGLLGNLMPQLQQSDSATRTITAYLHSTQLKTRLLKTSGVLQRLYASPTAKIRLWLTHGPSAQPGLSIALADEKLDKLLAIKSLANSQVIHLYWKDSDPRRCHDMLQLILSQLSGFLEKHWTSKAVIEKEFLQQRITNVRKDIAGLEQSLATRFGNTPRAENRNLPEIRRELLVSTSILEKLELRLAAVEAEAVRSSTAFTILDPPTMPDGPTGPRRFIAVLLGALAGLCIGGSLVFIRSATFHNKEQ